VPIISYALYAEKDSLQPSSLTAGEITGHTVKNAIRRRRRLIGREALNPLVNIGHVKEQNGNRLNQIRRLAEAF